MKHGSDFRATMRSGRKVVRKTIVVHIAESVSSEAPSIVGFAVSKSVGNAVARNRVKRRLRHAVAREIAAFPVGRRLVVHALPAADVVGYEQLHRDLCSVLGDVLGGNATEAMASCN